MAIAISTEIPRILTSNTYFWTPGGSAGQRRRNEARHVESVATWLRDWDFVVDESSNTVIGQREVNTQAVEVEFTYRESCRNVYKRCSVTRDGRRSNLGWLTRALEA